MTTDDDPEVHLAAMRQRAADVVRTHFSGWTKAGDFKYSARCPAHDDRKNSLSVAISRELKLLIKCHAGCSFREVIETSGVDHFNGFPITEVYEYRNAKGKLLFEVCRTVDKQFPCRLPSGKWGCAGQSVFYRLPDLLKAVRQFPKAPIYICEGEKDVNRCWDEGLIPATCVRGGASAVWRPEFTKLLTGRDIVILADNDTAGLQFAHRIAKELHDAE